MSSLMMMKLSILRMKMTGPFLAKLPHLTRHLLHLVNMGVMMMMMNFSQVTMKVLPSGRPPMSIADSLARQVAQRKTFAADDDDDELLSSENEDNWKPA